MQRDNTLNEVLRQIIGNIRKFLCRVEDKCETNQHYIGMQYLFRGLTITNWTETNFRTSEYADYNRIMIKHCMNYYVEYWKHRCDVAQNPQIQKRRMKE